MVPFSLSYSNGALAGLLTVLFFKGRPKDRHVKISSPRVPVRFLSGNTTETVGSERSNQGIEAAASL